MLPSWILALLLGFSLCVAAVAAIGVFLTTAPTTSPRAAAGDLNFIRIDFGDR